MKQSEALEEFKKILPNEAEFLAVSHHKFIGDFIGYSNEFSLWSHYEDRDTSLVASSVRSWEHALAIAKSGNEDVWPEDHSPIEGEE